MDVRLQLFPELLIAIGCLVVSGPSVKPWHREPDGDWLPVLTFE
jgi:hypothetical protein